MRPLFKDTTIGIEKVAASIKLEDDTDRWPIEILQAGYKSLPSLRNYEADVEIDHVDSARGYAVGKVLVYPHGLTKEAASGQAKLVSLPVIVRDYEMCPFDVYSYKSAMYPMDERALQEIMIKPQVYERPAERDQFGDPGLNQQLGAPTLEHNYGSSIALHKHASMGGLLGLALQTTEFSLLERFKEVVEGHEGIKLAYLHNPIFNDLHRNWTEVAEKSKEKTASEIRAERMANLKPSVAQFSYERGQFHVKMANHRCWAPTSEKVNRFEVQEILSPSQMSQLLTDGYVTLTLEPTAGIEHEKKAQHASRCSTMRVYSAGRSFEGVVLPHMLTLDGADMDKQLLLAADRHVMQEKIAGFVGESVTSFSPAPLRGPGVFVYQEGDRGFALEPVHILHKIAFADETEEYIAKRLGTGQDIRLLRVPGLQKVAQIRPGHYALPAELVFVPLKGGQVRCTDELEVVQALEHQKTASQTLQLHGEDPSALWFSGEDASLFRGRSYSQSETEFILGGFGLPARKAKELIKMAHAQGTAKIRGVRRILSEEERGEEVVKLAHVRHEKFRKAVPAVDLVKEAALLVHPRTPADIRREARLPAPMQLGLQKVATQLPKESVDAILSLNFMTPENASIYLNHLGLLQKTSCVLAELLVASRLGMDDVREAAALNAMTQVNAVVRGLEQLGEKIQ